MKNRIRIGTYLLLINTALGYAEAYHSTERTEATRKQELLFDTNTAQKNSTTFKIQL